MINIQPIEKIKHGNGELLSVHSIFYTIQGEGPLTGHPAVFIRLAGCNLQCIGCDTTYTGEGVNSCTVDEILREVAKMKNSAKLIVITGGEPFRQNITKLTEALLSHGNSVQIETNGTISIPDKFPKNAVLVVSPKTSKIGRGVLERAHCFKYIVEADYSDNDGFPTRVLGKVGKIYKPPKGRKIYMQPMDSGNSKMNYENLSECIKICLEYGHILQIQVHKIIGVD